MTWIGASAEGVCPAVVPENAKAKAQNQNAARIKTLFAGTAALWKMLSMPAHSEGYCWDADGVEGAGAVLSFGVLR